LSSDAAVSPSNALRKPSKRSIVVSVGLALAIVLAAWFVAGRQGLDDLGRGGVNQSLLPKAGEPAPDVRVMDILGNELQLSSLRGSVVWLNFWGSWCQPCRAEMPEIQEAYTTLSQEGVVLLAISLREPPIDAALFAARNSVSFPVFTDQFETATGAAYPVFNFPTHIFIDKSGTVRHVVLSIMTVDEAINYARDTASYA
jgi:peroxiredoxin